MKASYRYVKHEVSRKTIIVLVNGIILSLRVLIKFAGFE